MPVCQAVPQRQDTAGEEHLGLCDAILAGIHNSAVALPEQEIAIMTSLRFILAGASLVLVGACGGNRGERGARGVAAAGRSHGSGGATVGRRRPPFHDEHPASRHSLDAADRLFEGAFRAANASRLLFKSLAWWRIRGCKPEVFGFWPAGDRLNNLQTLNIKLSAFCSFACPSDPIFGVPWAKVPSVLPSSDWRIGR